MSDDEKKDCLVACKQLFPTRAFKVYNGLFDFKTSAIATKLDSEMWAEADQMMPHEWYLRYGTFLELPDHVEPAMQVTSKAAAASVAGARGVGVEQGGFDRDILANSHRYEQDKQAMQCWRVAVGSKGEGNDANT